MVINIVLSVISIGVMQNRTTYCKNNDLKYWNNFITSVISYIVSSQRAFDTLEIRIYKSKTSIECTFVGGIVVGGGSYGGVFKLRSDGSFEKEISENKYKIGRGFEEMEIEGEKFVLYTRMMGLPSIN